MNDILQKVQNIKEICLKDQQTGLLKLTEQFDKIKLKTLLFKVSKINLDPKLQDAIKIAKDNIYKFHKAEYDKLKIFEKDKIKTSQGITCWKRFTPIEIVGIYIPNKLFSSVLMTVILAQIAGCKEIIICTPPNPSKEILYTLYLLGIKQIYTIGGAQAIFSMAYGIGEIPKVDKIFGPGNEFVDTAKKMVSNEIAIDMPAGPSEVLVISDGINYQSIVHDLLAQLEHGKESKAWLFCTDKEIIKFIAKDIYDIAKHSPRWNILEYSLKNLIIKEIKNIDLAIVESNKIAPEHLILNVENSKKYLNKITNAGSVFIGRDTPESLGDYLSGTNHVLPTSGFAKSFSGLSILSFGKFITFQESTPKGLMNVSKQVTQMADAEGLYFHAQSVIERMILLDKNYISPDVEKIINNLLIDEKI